MFPPTVPGDETILARMPRVSVGPLVSLVGLHSPRMEGELATPRVRRRWGRGW